MEDMSRKREFEQAARTRDQIRAIGALYSGTRDINYFKEAEQLQRALNLPRLPERVETFDISNIMGNQSVGSMASFLTVSRINQIIEGSASVRWRASTIFECSPRSSVGATAV